MALVTFSLAYNLPYMVELRYSVFMSLNLAWVVTICKSKGLTWNKVVTDIEFPSVAACSELYHLKELAMVFNPSCYLKLWIYRA